MSKIMPLAARFSLDFGTTVARWARLL